MKTFRTAVVIASLSQVKTWLVPLKKTACLITVSVAFLATSTLFCRAQAPPVRWVQQAGGIAPHFPALTGNGLALDGFGNVFVVGNIQSGGNARFGKLTLPISTMEDDVFLVKYDSFGNTLWAVNAGGTNGNNFLGATGVATDAAGNAYIVGYFADASARFGNIVITNFGNAGSGGGFVAKVDSTGNFSWAKSLPASGDSMQKYGIATDNVGNCYVSGGFQGQVNLGGINLNYNEGGDDLFIAKFSPTGSVVWAIQGNGAIGSPATVVGVGVALVGNTNLVVAVNTGAFLFLAQYSSNGIPVWGPYGTNSNGGSAIATGADGSVCVAAGNFVAKYSSTGNLVWYRATSNATAVADCVDASNSVYVTGYFVGTANFSGTNLMSVGEEDIFVAKYDGAGNLLGVNGYGTTGAYDAGEGIQVTSFGDVYFTGEFENTNTIYFGGMSLKSYGNAAGTVSMFLVSLSSSNLLAVLLDRQPATSTNFVKRGPVTITLESSFPNGIIGYSLDGSDPRSSSILYTGPFTVSESALLRAVAYNSSFTESVEMDALQITILPTLTTSTEGGGTVSISPPSGPYLSNSIAQITAQPASGFMFLQWLGDASGTNPITTVAMSRNKYVKAVFGTEVGTIVIGGGSVSADPLLTLYPFGTTIRFTARPQTGNYFGQWGAAASGANNPLNFVVSTANPSVSATFPALAGGKYALTVIEGGNGHVTVNPYANNYTNGQAVMLAAVPDAGQNFIGWNGDASGVASPLLVTMNQNKTITASFTASPSLQVGTTIDGMVDGGFRLTINGEFGAEYQILNSTNLAIWTPLGTVTNTFGVSQFLDANGSNAPLGFYRLMQTGQ